ncbi:hypothetical protein BKA83DRAFT_2889101 [Pisolithus microcarpus]|nr:hypothetical protein BKA83DRAFT_2889101 [Pisolithus microcarpus]
MPSWYRRSFFFSFSVSCPIEALFEFLQNQPERSMMMYVCQPVYPFHTVSSFGGPWRVPSDREAWQSCLMI